MIVTKKISCKKGEEYLHDFINPHGALVKCRVTEGKGEITLYEDDEKIVTYKLSIEPGVSTFVQLNTDREHKKWRVTVKGTGNGDNKFELELPQKARSKPVKSI